MGITQTVAPTVEPVLHDELLLHLRIDDDEETGLIESINAAARQMVETDTGLQLRQATYAQTFDCFTSVMLLSVGPVLAVSSIQYIDTDGNTQTLASSEYKTVINLQRGRVHQAYNVVYPSIRHEVDAVTITYTTGYATVPDWAKAAIKLVAGELYENRQPGEKMPSWDTYKRLIGPHKIRVA